MLVILCSFCAATFSQTDTDRQKKYLEDILQINIKQRIKENTRRTTWQDSIKYH